MNNEFLPLFYTFHFYLFGLIALVSAILFVTRKSPVAAALWLVNVMFCLAALYVMLDAQFIGAIQVLVYAGAIMVVFLFVVMLLNLGKPEDVSDIRGQLPRVTAGFVGLALLAEVMVLARGRFIPTLTLPVPPSVDTVEKPGGIIGPIADVLLKEQVLAFQLSAVLLLVAIVGAVVIGRKRS
ncbi:MAG: NADH-quinone oxidoreductase subunit J [Gemmatimonadaceae bacterium]|nr:NADH-quinone oxidoreductase subunit J [Gemmatimonadaceae bacterium]MCW5825162.1 NADH-quinone oxidoreductase subunit J [Gemmatimonadaceae bacterium]